MKPSYTQVQPEAVANITVATKARQVEAWLAALPFDDVPASVRLLADYLRAHDDLGVALALRKQVLELATAPCRRLLSALGAGFRDMPLPMETRQLAQVDLALHLLGAVSDFCRHLILDHADRSPPLFGGNPLPPLLGRFLQWQHEKMMLCHLSHRQLPDGFWRESHETGQRLFSTGLAAVTDPDRPTVRLGDRYLVLLLEAVADPYHLSAQERSWTQGAIAQHGDLAIVEPAGRDTHSSVFGIRTREDKPPFPLSWQGTPEPDCDLLLNTTPLVRKLALLISQIDRNQIDTLAVPQARYPAYRELLQRLKLTWGGGSQRTTARHQPASPSQRIAVVGFYPVYHYLSGAGMDSEKDSFVECRMVNESLGGMALQITRPALRLKVGTLVCVGRGSGDGWQDIGLVRWFKTGSDGMLTFGIKYLYGRMRPCTWNRLGEGQSYPGLLADLEKGQAKVARHLITPSLHLDPKAQIDILQEDEHRLFRLEGKAESFAEIDVFRCRS